MEESNKTKEKIEKMFSEIEEEKKSLREERMKTAEAFAKILANWLIKIQDKWDKLFSKSQDSEVQTRIALTQGNKNTGEISKNIGEFLDIKKKEKDEIRKVHVENQIEIPKVNFPKEIKVSNLPKSETNLVVRAIKALGERLKAVGQVFITNKNPADAIPVRLVDKSSQKFYDAVLNFLGGPGISTKDIEDKLDNLNTLITDSLQHYIISDKDETASPYYYGFIDKVGNWYILRETITGSASAYTYCKGSSGYATAWTNRATQTYDYFYNIF